ncbi:MAG: 3-dehydroquinate synthase, partial [Myxococcales bacterium]|nr:3-dehydroquinate synthase [Myxococcales bacterium]
DAAIGGKTAINTPRGKNLIGAFHHPRAVVLDEAALAELPRIERLNGLAEAVKHAVIRDAALFDALEAWPGDDALLPEPLLHRCVAIKAEVVAADASDAGLRNMLNYGHTVAHAIEGATHGGMAHGHAVAVGMVVEARLAEAEGGFPSADRARLERLLERLGLPTTPPCSFEAAAPFFLSDKKNEAGEIRCAIPAAIGQSLPTSGRFTRAVSRAALQRAWGPP